MEAKDTVIRLKRIPEKIFKGHGDTIEAKLAYIAGFKDGSEAQAEVTSKAVLREAGLQLRAKIGGIDEAVDWSNEGLRQFRELTLKVVEDLLKEWKV